MVPSNPEELKLRLRAGQVCEEDLTRRMSEVELILGERKLTNSALTLREAAEGQLVDVLGNGEKTWKMILWMTYRYR